MNIELTDKEFRRLLDLVYIGNWVLNSARGEDRFEDYDALEEKFFSLCLANGKFRSLVQLFSGRACPSCAYEEGGIHEAIAEYEDTVFFEILAEELARRDMNFEPISQDNYSELAVRIDEYISEFEKNGVENISIDL